MVSDERIREIFDMSDEEREKLPSFDYQSLRRQKSCVQNAPKPRLVSRGQNKSRLCVLEFDDGSTLISAPDSELNYLVDTNKNISYCASHI